MSDKTTTKPVAKRSAKPAKAKAKPAKDLNKSEEIRQVASQMKDKGEKPRPVSIIAALKERGVEVSSPQVSMVLKRMGSRPRRRRKAAKRGAAVATTNGSAKAVRSKAAKISIEDLVAAKKAVGQLGGLDRALAAIQALRQFEG